MRYLLYKIFVSNGSWLVKTIKNLVNSEHFKQIYQSLFNLNLNNPFITLGTTISNWINCRFEKLTCWSCNHLLNHDAIDMETYHNWTKVSYLHSIELFFKVLQVWAAYVEPVSFIGNYSFIIGGAVLFSEALNQYLQVPFTELLETTQDLVNQWALYFNVKPFIINKENLSYSDLKNLYDILISKKLNFLKFDKMYETYAIKPDQILKTDPRWDQTIESFRSMATKRFNLCTTTSSKK